MFYNDFISDNNIYKNKINEIFESNLLSSKDELIIKMGKLPLVYNLYENNILNANLYIHKSTINHFISKHKYINKDIVLKLYESLINPIIIFNGNEKDTILSILNLKSKDGYYFQTPIYMNYKENNLYINAIGTLYHQKALTNYIVKEILKHNTIAYNKKIEPYIHSIGLLLSVEEDKFSIYDDTIAYTLNNVNNHSNAIYYTFNTENKYFKPTFKASKTELINAINELSLNVNKLFNINTMIPYTNSDDYINNISLIQKKLIDNKYKQIELLLQNITNKQLDMDTYIQQNVKPLSVEEMKRNSIKNNAKTKENKNIDLNNDKTITDD